MKKILIISLLFVSCEGKSFQDNWIINCQNTIDNATIVTKNGCEYLAYNTGDNYIGFSHKGDCKNPIHYFKEDKNLYKYNIVLPQEYPLVSTNKNKPDTFTAYANRDTIYFKFRKK